MEFMGYVTREKEKLNHLLKQFEEKRGELEAYKLQPKMIHGKRRYYYKMKGSDKLHYIGWRKNPELLRKLLDADNAKKAIPLIQENLELLKTLEERYHPSAEILRRNLEEKQMEDPAAVPERDRLLPPSEKQRHREKLQHDTGLGFFTRSKSEAIIALRLHRWGLQFAYERPLRIQGADGRWRTIYPDFTIYLADGRVVYLEHLGMFSTKSYREGVVERLADYHAAGILTGRDLFLTMDGPDGQLDVAAIDRLIENNFL